MAEETRRVARARATAEKQVAADTALLASAPDTQGSVNAKAKDEVRRAAATSRLSRAEATMRTAISAAANVDGPEPALNRSTRRADTKARMARQAIADATAVRKLTGRNRSRQLPPTVPMAAPDISEVPDTAYDAPEAVASAIDFAPAQRALGLRPPEVPEKDPRGFAAFDMSDMDALMEALKGTPRGITRSDRNWYNKERKSRMEQALTAQRQNDLRYKSEQLIGLQGRETDAVIASKEAVMGNADMTDSQKKYMENTYAIVENTALGNSPLRQAALAQAATWAIEAENRDILAAERGGPDGMETKADGGVVGYADGGEVDDADDAGAMLAMMQGGNMEDTQEMPAMPEAVDTTPVQMESGDYIVPVEAMRFYGKKFFQDLIDKVDDME